MKRPNIFLDSIFVVVFVFLLIGALKFNPINFHVFDVKESWKDLELTDIYFSRIKSRNVRDSSIVIIDIDTLGRKSIARLLRQVNACRPAAIALDAYFASKKTEAADTMLANAFRDVREKLVLSGYFALTPDARDSPEPNHAWVETHSFFGHHTVGHTNFVGDYAHKTTIRYFRPVIQDKNAFGVEVVRKVDRAKADRLANRGNDYEVINYLGDFRQFYSLRYDADFADPRLSARIKDRIVLLGYAGDIAKKKSVEDAHFTPLNEELAGRSLPDMYGVVLHANIISMILRGDYINEVSVIWNVVLAVVIGFLHIIVYIFFFVQRHKWFHLVAKISQLLTSIILMFVVIGVLAFLGLKFDPALMLLVILLSVDVLYFYEPAAPYLTGKLRFKTYFSHH